MNLLDLAVVVTAGTALLSGWKFGFTARLLAWAGVGAGLMFGVAFVGRVVTNFGGTSPNGRATAGIVFLALSAVIGDGVGLALAILLDRLRVSKRALSTTHRVAGASIGFVGAVLLAVLVVPSLASLPGWPSDLARRSWTARRVGYRAPFTSVLSKAITRAPYARPERESGPPRVARPPTSVTLPFPIDQRVRRSVVLVSADSCDVTQTGTGWVADRGLVVTAAHVVSGAHDVSVQDAYGSTHHADIVTVDPDDDVAVLRADDLRVAALDVGHAAKGDTGVVLGHPRGGDLRAAPASIVTVKYETFTGSSGHATYARYDLVLAARLDEGDSGAPLVSQRGKVIGVVFALREGGAAAVAVDDVFRTMHAPARRQDRTCVSFPG